MTEEDDLPQAEFEFPEDDIDIVLDEPTDDEPDTEEEKEPEQDDEESLDDFQGKFRKRLEREQRAKLKERQEKEALAAEAARLRAELQAEQAVKGDLLKRSTDHEAAVIDRELEIKKAKYKALRAEFDPEKADEEITLFDEIAELNAKRRELARAQPEPPKAERSPEAPKLTKQAQSWMERNEWFGKKQYEAQTAAAHLIDQQLTSEGYAHDDPQYYNELDRRLQEQVRLPTSKRDDTPSPVQSGRASTSASKGKVVITKEDQALMRKVGLDPKNRTHLREWAKEKLAMERG
jgi:hypothetical protein